MSKHTHETYRHKQFLVQCTQLHKDNLLNWSVGFIYFPLLVVLIDLLPILRNSCANNTAVKRQNYASSADRHHDSHVVTKLLFGFRNYWLYMSSNAEILELPFVSTLNSISDISLAYWYWNKLGCNVVIHDSFPAYFRRRIFWSKHDHLTGPLVLHVPPMLICFSSG